MKDVKCPYCGEEKEIRHDDGDGFDENFLHNQQCNDCDKYFAFTTSISYFYKAYKADCLNDGEHKYKPTTTYPVEYTRMECLDCGDIRDLTEEEWKMIKVVH